MNYKQKILHVKNMKTDMSGYIRITNICVTKRLKTFSLVILSFILGCTFTLALIPIDKTCQIDNTDREYNIMQNSKFKDPELIILILSSPDNFDRRNILRYTWLSLRNEDPKLFQVKHYFIIGTFSLSSQNKKLLHNEQIDNEDILTVPIQDSYRNLTEKLKLGFQWLDSQFVFGLRFKYVLKCDDDSFVNLKSLIPSLMKIEFMLRSKPLNNKITSDENPYISTNFQQPSLAIEDPTNLNGTTKVHPNLYWGYFSGNARIKTKGKWKETNWIASDRYVPYAVGGGYLLSQELVAYIAKNANFLKSFNSEDVSVGFWLAPINNIYRIHDVRFDTEWTSRGCKNNYLITHNISPNQMRFLHQTLVHQNKLCVEEVTNRSAYIYNWDVPPSQCCKKSTVIDKNFNYLPDKINNYLADGN